MDYEIVRLEEKTAVGICARTNNGDPDMGAVIGTLWNRFYSEGIYASIPKKANDKALGIYTDYSKDATGDYTVMVACEVNGEMNDAANGTVTDTTNNAANDTTNNPANDTTNNAANDTVSGELAEKSNPDHRRKYVVRRIPAGSYARFIVHGDMVKAVAAAWQEIWQMDLPRSFQCDFEIGLPQSHWL